MSDTGTDLLVELGKFSGTDPESGKTYEDEDDLDLVDAGAEPVATVTGTAADLDTWLWKRDPALTPAPTRATGSGSTATGSPTRSCPRSWGSRSTEHARRRRVDMAA